MTKWLMSAAMVFGGPVAAHDFEELEIALFVKRGPEYDAINFAETHMTTELVCALYDKSWRVSSSRWITDNLATRVVVQYDGRDVAAAAECPEPMSDEVGA